MKEGDMLANKSMTQALEKVIESNSMTKIALAVTALALSAWVEVRIPGTVVPFTFQTLVVLGIGIALSPSMAFKSIAAYIVLGGLGAPVWSGASFGWTHFTGPTGGYIIGFLLAAPLLAMAREVFNPPDIGSRLFLVLFGQIMIFLPGLLWLSAFTGVDNAVAVGLVPFIPSASIKSFLAMGYWKIARG
jgi:biotin transport system substrate-specific component